MTRPFAVVTTVGAVFGLWLGATPLEAQLYETADRARFEISPIASYQWGGSFEADAGDLKLDDGVAWGVVLSFLADRQLGPRADLPASGYRPPGPRRPATLPERRPTVPG